MTRITLDMYQTMAVAVAALYLGQFIKRRAAFLEKFCIPVPVIGEEFDCALLGKKGKWYDHKVMVSDPVPVEEQN